MKISKIQIKNFLSIGEVEVLPGKVTQIVGLNNAGKTTVLRALEVAFKGSSDGSLVKRGEDQAEIILEFDNELSVRRRIRADGNQDVFVKKGEFKADAPQGLLNGMVGPSAFNPLDLLEPKTRNDTLLRVIDLKISEADVMSAMTEGENGAPPIVPVPPLDYSQHGLKVAEQAFKYLYQRRAEANKDAKAKAEVVRVKEADLPKELAQVFRSKDEIYRDIEAQKEKIAEQAKRSIQVKEQSIEITLGEARVSEASKKAANSQAQAEMWAKSSIEAQHEEKRSHENLELLKKAAELVVREDLGAIQIANDLIQKAQAELLLIAEKEKDASLLASFGLLKEQAEKADSFSQGLDRVVQRLGKPFKAKLMAGAALPVAGLSYEDGVFFLDGSALENLSSSVALKLSLVLARKMAGEAKLICIDGAELLDQGSYADLRKEIQDDGFLYFISKVGLPFAQSEGDKVVQMQGGVAV